MFSAAHYSHITQPTLFIFFYSREYRLISIRKYYKQKYDKTNAATLLSIVTTSGTCFYNLVPHHNTCTTLSVSAAGIFDKKGFVIVNPYRSQTSSFKLTSSSKWLVQSLIQHKAVDMRSATKMKQYIKLCASICKY